MKSIALALTMLLLVVSPVQAIVIHNGALLIGQDDYLVHEWYGTRFKALEQVHMVNPVEVVRAIREMDAPLVHFTGVNIYLLRRKMTGFSGIVFDPNTIILAGTCHNAPQWIHHMVTHELGHIVYERMTPSQKSEYRRMRGLKWYHEQRYLTRATEVFAEDFRVLFGSELARRAVPRYFEYLHGPSNEVEEWIARLLTREL